MKVCRGTWPDTGTPCLRMLDVNGKCPKLHDENHREKSPAPSPGSGGSSRVRPGRNAAHDRYHVIIDVDSIVTGEIVARWCVDCEERVDNW